MRDLLKTRILRLFARVRRDDTGAAMVEYGLLVGLITLVVALAAQIAGHDISTIFSEIGSFLTTL